jgi:uncharacterized protein
MNRLAALLLLFLSLAQAQEPKRILFLTHSAGFRHGSIEAAREVLGQLAIRSGRFTVFATEDLSTLNPERLNSFDAVFFFTSGELPISPIQKQALLDFVRNGKGFGGAHSATDTLYTWPEYGQLIGGIFDGHPWTEQVRIDVEEINDLTRHLAPRFAYREEIYQFRAFERTSLRVLMTLDTSSINLAVDGVNRRDEDFALTWIKPYGQGRVFYTALGHFDETWRDPGFQQTLLPALEWLAGLRPNIDATPRMAPPPTLADNGIGNAATVSPTNAISPGSLISIYGANLTEGQAMSATSMWPSRLAGSSVRINNQPLRLLYSGPFQINALVPFGISALPCVPFPGGSVCRPSVDLEVRTASGRTITRRVELHTATPAVFVVTSQPGALTLWMTGLGPVDAGTLRTTELPVVTINDQPVRVLYSGLAPGFEGLYQVNVEIAEPAAISDIRLRIHNAETLLQASRSTLITAVEGPGAPAR